MSNHRKSVDRSVRRGAVVKFYKFGGWQKGIVLRLLPWNDFSRAYGRQAVVAVYSKRGVHEHEVGVADMRVVGRVKHIPKTVVEDVPQSRDAVAHHERIRDIRRAGQGAHYDPKAPHNQWAERPVPPTQRTVVARRRARGKGRG